MKIEVKKLRSVFKWMNQNKDIILCNNAIIQCQYNKFTAVVIRKKNSYRLLCLND